MPSPMASVARLRPRRRAGDALPPSTSLCCASGRRRDRGGKVQGTRRGWGSPTRERSPQSRPRPQRRMWTRRFGAASLAPHQGPPLSLSLARADGKTVGPSLRHRTGGAVPGTVCSSRLGRQLMPLTVAVRSGFVVEPGLRAVHRGQVRPVPIRDAPWLSSGSQRPCDTLSPPGIPGRARR